MALLGSSGCGKTSTLRMIAGFESVTEGAITLAGQRIDQLPPARRGVAMAFEGYALYPPLTVEQNIGFGLPRGPAAQKRVADVAEMLEIGPILTGGPPGSPAGSSSAPSLARALARDATCTCSTSRWASSSRSCAPCCAGGSRRCARSAG